MSMTNPSIEAPAEAALAPFRCYAAAMVAAEEGLMAFAHTASEMTRGVMTFYAQQAQIGLGSAEIAVKLMSELPASKDAIWRGLVAAKTFAQRFDEEPRWSDAGPPPEEPPIRTQPGRFFVLPD